MTAYISNSANQSPRAVSFGPIEPCGIGAPFDHQTTSTWPYPVTDRTRYVMCVALAFVLDEILFEVENAFDDLDDRERLDDFPPSVCEQPAKWWLQVIEAGHRLLDGMSDATAWNPRNPAEEVVLAVVVRSAAPVVLEMLIQGQDPGLGWLCDHGAEDYQFEAAFAALASDGAALSLWDKESPLADSGIRAALGTADYRPTHWFDDFDWVAQGKTASFLY